MKKIVYILIVASLLYSCALSETQIKAANQFAETSKNFSQYPSKIFTVLADIREKRAIYNANFNYDNPEQFIGELDDAYDEKKRNYKFSEKTDLTFKIIDKYAQSLLLLTSDKYTTDLEKQSKVFGNDIDSLISKYNNISGVTKIPTGIGGLVGQLVMFGGKLYIQNQQGIRVKKYVPIADALIEKMTDNMTNFLTNKIYLEATGDSISIETLIDNEKEGLNLSYQAYLLACKKLHLLPELESEKEYLALRNDLDNLKELLSQTRKAVKGLRQAHSNLLKAIQEKKNLKDCIKELQSYYEDVKGIYETIQKIDQ